VDSGVQNLGARIRSHNWRSGSVIAAADAKHVLGFLRHSHDPSPRAVSPADWLIVVSHTCDLYTPNESAEPLVEVLHATPVAKPDTNFKNQKSTRRLHFRPDRDASPNLWLNVHATLDRFVMPRAALTSLKPDTTRQVTDSAANALRGWLALRLDRPAWPDDLVDRLNHSRDAIVKALAPLNDDSTELRVTFSGPARDDDSFELTVFLVVDEEIWNSDSVRRAACYNAFNALISILTKTAGIKVSGDSQVISGAEFTWQLLRQTDIWNFANLTPIDT